MSSIIPYLGSAAIVLLFIGGIYAVSSSSYGDWVREFYARRDRLQTLFGSNKGKKAD